MAVQSVDSSDSHLVNESPNNFGVLQEPISFASWVNVTSFLSTVSMIGVYDTQPDAGFQFGIRGGSQSYGVWGWGYDSYIETGSFTTGVWHHICYVYDGTTNFFYINGEIIGTTTSAVQTGTVGNIFMNGYPTGGTAETGAFQFDDVRLYKRALSANEVLSMYTLRGRDRNLFNLVANYRFNEQLPGNSVTSVTDFSGSGNDLTFSGTGTIPTYVQPYIQYGGYSL